MIDGNHAFREEGRKKRRKEGEDVDLRKHHVQRGKSVSHVVTVDPQCNSGNDKRLRSVAFLVWTSQSAHEISTVITETMSMSHINHLTCDFY